MFIIIAQLFTSYKIYEYLWHLRNFLIWNNKICETLRLRLILDLRTFPMYNKYSLFMILFKHFFQPKEQIILLLYYSTVRRVWRKYLNTNTELHYICTTSYYFQCVPENDSRLRSINAGPWSIVLDWLVFQRPELL